MKRGSVIKLQALTRLMNNYGTNPRIRVLKKVDFGYLLIYEGHPDGADDEMKQLKIQSFTILGKGLLNIYCV